MIDNKYPDFTGKVISITIIDDEQNNDMISPTFEMQAGRLFICGEVPKGASRSNWCAGKMSAVAWDRVTDYIVFDSLDDYKAAIEISENYHQDDDDDD